jgi:hypothetical protein
MAMNKHATNEHGLDLGKYMAHKNDLEGKDGGKQQKCKHMASITLTTTPIFLKM